MHLFNKNDELNQKNDVIVREVRRNQQLIDRAVQNGVKRATMLMRSMTPLLIGTGMLLSCTQSETEPYNSSIPLLPEGQTVTVAVVAPLSDAATKARLERTAKWMLENLSEAQTGDSMLFDGATLQFNIDGEQQQVNKASITAPATPAAVRMRLAGKRE